MKALKEEVTDRINNNGQNERLIEAAYAFTKASIASKYSYNFSWLGRPIIQYPQDMIAMQEIIWDVKPDLIIETGIAHGGSLIFSASMLELNAACGGPQNAEVLGVDIDIRAHAPEACGRPHGPRGNRRGVSWLSGSRIFPDSTCTA